MNRRGRVAGRVWLLAGAIVAAVTISIVAVSCEGDDSPSAGPLHDDHAGAATGVTFSGSERIWTAVVEGTFDGNDAARVSGLTMLPVPGFPTPKLLASGYITTGGIGSGRGRPDQFFTHESLVDAVIRPTDNRTHHLAGVMLVLQAGQKRGLYAIEGVQVDYTIGSTKHRSRLYTAVTGCVPPEGKKYCPDSTRNRAIDLMLKDSGD